MSSMPQPPDTGASRDPMLARFEDYLLKKLKPSDVLQDDTSGAYLFNVNQTAYVIERSSTDDAKRATRMRVNAALASGGIETVLKRAPRCSQDVADVRFCTLEGAYNLTIHHLKGPRAERMREESRITTANGISKVVEDEESGIIFANGIKKGIEDDMAEHLLAWAQCNFIPMYTSRNRKAFEGCVYRPDVIWDLPDICVMLECDQYAHANYNKEKEMERMKELTEAADKRGFNYVVFIRFNPSLPGSTSQFKFSTLLSVLMDVFAKKEHCVGGGKSVIHLFYPGALNVWYPAEALAELVGTKRGRVE